MELFRIKEDRTTGYNLDPLAIKVIIRTNGKIGMRASGQSVCENLFWSCNFSQNLKLFSVKTLQF